MFFFKSLPCRVLPRASVSQGVGVVKATERNRDDDGKQVKSNPVFYWLGGNMLLTKFKK